MEIEQSANKIQGAKTLGGKMKSKRLAPLILGALVIAVLCGRAPSLRAQSSTTGALTGTVTDPSGAFVAGATVTLLNTATGQTQAKTTDTNGSYGFATLAPGTYSVRFTAQGFKTVEMASVVVNVSEAPALDAKLEVGETTQVVACQCTVRETTTSSTGTLVDSKTITSVPLTTRNFTQVLSMSSGSAADVNNAGTLGRGTLSVNVNGNTAAGAYTINGAWATSTVPNPDTLSEFKIQTSAYDSGYGAMAPQTNVLTKSGANDFHGDLWEFIRNDIFNANAYFRIAAGQPKPNLKQNQFGGTLGGPIKRDKLFFFGTYQGTRQVNALDSSSGANLVLPPIPNEDRSSPSFPRDLATAICAAGSPATFAGGTPLACDGSNINPIALSILRAKTADGSGGYWIPTPQSIITSGKNAGLGFSSYSAPSKYNENQYMVNTDYVISKKHTLSSKLFFSRLFQFRTFGAPIAAGLVQFTPGGPQGLNAHDYVISLKLTSVLTSSIVNEARFDFTRNNSFAYGPNVPTATSLGMQPADKYFNEPPEMTIQGAFGVYRVFGNGANDFSTTTNTYQYSDNVSWVHGKQTSRIGAFVAKQDNGRLDTGAARGKVTFQNFTDFLVGLNAAQNGSTLSNVFSVSANEGVGPNGEVQYQYENYHIAAFVEDDIKLTPRFTANLGLRWEYIGPSFDTLGTVGNTWPSLLNLAPIPPAGGTLVGETVAANYNATMINPYTGQAFGPPPAGVFVRSTKSFYQNDAPLDAFSPRLGFAWQPGSQQKRLSMRGGYGWFYSVPTFSGNAAGTPLFTAQPFAQGFGNTGASNSTSSLVKLFPDVTLGFIPRTLTSRLSDRVAGPILNVAKTQQWNLNIQYSFSRSFSLDVGYVGSYGNHLLLQRGLNQPQLASTAHPVNCGYDGVATDCITTNTSANAAQRVPILGELPTALGDNDFVGQSWYHGLQATFRKQLSRGLTFQAAYTFSKSENNTTLFNDQNNLSLDWARATFDRTQRLIANFNYELPSVVQSKGFIGAMASGWSLSGIFIMQSGTPMTLRTPVAAESTATREFPRLHFVLVRRTRVWRRQAGTSPGWVRGSRLRGSSVARNCWDLEPKIPDTVMPDNLWSPGQGNSTRISRWGR